MFNKDVRESTQKKLERVRPPRVQLTYDVEVYGAIEKRELPFEVAILADLSQGDEHNAIPLIERKWIDIDLDNFYSVLKGLAPRLVLSVKNALGGECAPLNIDLTFRCLDDFDPGYIAGQVEPLRILLDERDSLNDRLTSDNEFPEQEYESIHYRLQQIDTLLSKQIDEIIHTESFQRLESSWSGLYFLVSQTETSSTMRLRVLDVSKNELCRDFHRCKDFQQSALFKHVYEGEYGTFGGRAIGLIIGDYELTPQPPDTYLLKEMAHVAAAAHAPFIAAADMAFFGMESFSELGNPRDIAKVFATPEYAWWRSFRQSEDARYVGLVLPRILLRHPYGEIHSLEAFDYQEGVTRHEHFLWGNPAYAVGVCITNSFVKYHWCAAIKGVEGGGLIEGLPVATFVSDYGEPAPKCPTEIALGDRREVELAHLGFIPLLHMKGTDHAVFFSMQSCYNPPSYETDSANANSRLSAQLPYVLTTSRFAHYIKSIVRDRVGSFTSRADCQESLNRWLSQYISSDDNTVENKAQFPLRDASVDVTEMPGKPGVYRAVLFLRPRFQLDELSVSLRVVVELPPPAHG